MTSGGSGNGSSIDSRNSALLEMEKILLRRFFSNLSRAGVNIRPLTRQLSMLSGLTTEGRGYLAMANDSLSRRLTPSRKWCLKEQLSLLEETLWTLNSILSELSRLSQEREEVKR